MGKSNLDFERAKMAAICIVASSIAVMALEGFVWWNVAPGLTLFILHSCLYRGGSGSTQLPPNTATVVMGFLLPKLTLAILLASCIRSKPVEEVIKSKKGDTIKVQRSGGSDVERLIVSKLSYLYVDVIGCDIEAEFIEKPLLDAAPVDQYNAIEDMHAMKWTISHGNDVIIKRLPAFMMTLFCLATFGQIGVVYGLVGSIYMSIAFCSNTATQPRYNYRPKGTSDFKFTGPQGIYKLHIYVLGCKYHLGVGYADEGTFYTRYHVTSGNDIRHAGNTYTASRVNIEADNISYGAEPKYHRVCEGEEITVAVAGGFCNSVVTFRSVACLDKRGNIFIRGHRTLGGVSGSPAFVKREKEVCNSETMETRLEVTYDYIGCVGYLFDYDIPEISYSPNESSAIQLIPRDETSSGVTHNVIDGNILQIFEHPGSGKTRNTIPALTRTGLAKYGKVYVTGPTRVVAAEIYKALNAMPEFQNDVALRTSDASAFERGTLRRRIVVTAHASALSMLIKGDFSMSQPGLWIVDEAHFNDTRSFCLIDLLRHRVSTCKRGSLVELTATGYHIGKKVFKIKDGTNYPVEDIHMSEEEMTKSMMVEGSTKKVIVFVTSERGRSPTSAEMLSRTARSKGIPYVVISRKTFSTTKGMAREMDKGIIFTTDISECGANYEADTVYDFQKSPKCVVVDRSVVLEPRIIDEGQRVQRRGRVGRSKEGTYVSPGYNLNACDFTRIEHYERALFCKVVGINSYCPLPEPHDIPLTLSHIKMWLASGEKGYNSAYTCYTLLKPNGVPRNAHELREIAMHWKSSKRAQFTFEGDPFNCDYYDARDHHHYERLAKLATSTEETRTETRLMRNVMDLIRVAQTTNTVSTLGIIHPYTKEDKPQIDDPVKRDRRITPNDAIF